MSMANGLFISPTLQALGISSQQKALVLATSLDAVGLEKRSDIVFSRLRFRRVNPTNGSQAHRLYAAFLGLGVSQRGCSTCKSSGTRPLFV